jgi:hypothetical protein
LIEDHPLTPKLPPRTPDRDDASLPSLDLPLAADIATLAASPNPAHLSVAEAALRARLHRALRDQLDALLCAGHNDRIQHMLYRVDVDERRVLSAWRSTLPSALPDALASLLLDRLLQIAQSRREQRFPVHPDEAW